MVNARANLELCCGHREGRRARRSTANGRASLFLLLLAARESCIPRRCGEPLLAQEGRGGLELWYSLDTIKTARRSGKTSRRPLPPVRSIARSPGPDFELDQEGRRPRGAPDMPSEEGQASVGVIGVLRKMASRAATKSETAMPPTHAVHPNMSKVTPSTALPIKPPKK